MDDLKKMLENANSSYTEDNNDIQEEDFENDETDYSMTDDSSFYYEDESGDNLVDNNDYEDEVFDKELYEKMLKQSEKYEKEIERMQNARKKYEAAEKEIKGSSKKRGHFELDLNKSNLEGDTILDRLGYDKTAKGNPKYHKIENYIDSHVANSKIRIGIYAGICVITFTFVIIRLILHFS